MNLISSHSTTRSRFLAAAASLAIAGAMGFGVVTTDTAPALADAVKLDQPVQAPSFADIVEKVSPAVVSVRVKGAAQQASEPDAGSFDMPGLDQLPDDHPLKRFFKEFRQHGDRDQGHDRRHHQRGHGHSRPIAQGSGFFVSEDGYLVTNNHVVEGGSDYSVVMDDGTELDAKLVGTDPRTDLAVLKVDGDRKFTYVAFADDAKVRVGDWVVAVGNPFGLGGTVTAGIVSARGRDIGAGPYDDFIQIDAAVNRGNSGGPAFDLTGEVVGVNTAIFSPSGGNVGIAFAIPGTVAKNVVSELIKNGSVQRGWLGVQIQPVTKDIADSLGLEKDKGALVAQPQDGSPADKAGIKAGDVVVAVNGDQVESPRDLARTIAGIEPGKSVEVTLWRNGKSKNVDLTLGTLPKMDKMASAEPTPANPDEGDSLTDFGMTVTTAEDGKGLLVTDVESGSDAEEHGIQAGDVILSINSKEVTSVDDVSSAVAEAAKAGRNAVLVQIRRQDTNRFVALPVEKS